MRIIQKTVKIFKNRAKNSSNMQFYAKKLWAKSSPTPGVVGSNPIGYAKKERPPIGGFFFCVLGRKNCSNGLFFVENEQKNA